LNNPEHLDSSESVFFPSLYIDEPLTVWVDPINTKSSDGSSPNATNFPSWNRKFDEKELPSMTDLISLIVI